MNKNEIEVLYQLGAKGTLPDQGYPDDFAYDMYASRGVLVPPLTFRSVIIPTDLKTAFDPIKAGMKIAIRSGVASKTPLIVANSPGIVEGTYRNGIGILVRNTFIDNSLVDFVFNEKGERVPLKEVPKSVLKDARKFYEEETERLGYEGLDSVSQNIAYKSVVPRGTIYVAEGKRIAQMYFSPKIFANFKEADHLPETERGTGGFGSSGTNKK